jgi:hypothetical protein
VTWPELEASLITTAEHYRHRNRLPADATVIVWLPDWYRVINLARLQEHYINVELSPDVPCTG